jgi:hypothetical protein
MKQDDHRTGYRKRKLTTNALNNLSLRGVERRSNPKKNEIAAPFGLAMTCKEIYCVGIIIGSKPAPPWRILMDMRLLKNIVVNLVTIEPLAKVFFCGSTSSPRTEK